MDKEKKAEQEQPEIEKKVRDLEKRIQFLENHISNSSDVNGEIKKTEQRLWKRLDTLIGKTQASIRISQRIERAVFSLIHQEADDE